MASNPQMMSTAITKGILGVKENKVESKQRDFMGLNSQNEGSKKVTSKF